MTLGGGDELAFTVRFAPGAAALPMVRTGVLTVTTTDLRHPTFTVELRGSVKLCDLRAAPSPLDFGNVTLNARQTAQLALTNAGQASCDLTRVVFGAGTDSLFTFVPPAPVPVVVVAGASVPVELAFTASSSAAPLNRTGTVVVTSNDPAHPELVVPLSAFVSTVCTQAGQFIYTVDGNGMFSRFDPTTLTSTDIGPLNCPSAASPYSMNVDQSGIAWIIFDDGHLFRVDTANAACLATSYVPGQQGFSTYGMGSVFDSSPGKDTLYLAAGQPSGSTSRLGTLAYPSLTVTQVATVPIGYIELAGTGDGQLWGYAPKGSANGGPLLAQLNRVNGAVVDRYDLPEIFTVGGFAVKFFGGAFYIFVGSDVWRVDRSALPSGKTTPTMPAKRVLTNPGRDIVGAGVSTCAPVH